MILTQKYNKLTAQGKSKGMQNNPHPKEITKDIRLNTLTTQWNLPKEIHGTTQVF